MSIQEFVGRALGGAVAPFTFLGSLIRGDRIFHPDGVIYRATVKPIAKEGPIGQLAQRLAGTALVRLSGGVWPWPQGARRPDLLGLAVRFRAENDVNPELLPGDQDLLFATAETLPSLVLAPFRTDIDDFLANRYYAILPFTLAGVGEVYLRISPQQASPEGADRRERLARAVAEGEAVLQLEIQVEDRHEPWQPIAEVDLRERLPIAEEALSFDPETSAKGLVPRGVLQWTRPAAYLASRTGWRLRG